MARRSTSGRKKASPRRDAVQEDREYVLEALREASATVFVEACDAFVEIIAGSRVDDAAVSQGLLAAWEREVLAPWKTVGEVGEPLDDDSASEQLRAAHVKRIENLRPAEQQAIYWSAKEIERVARDAMFNVLRDKKFLASLVRLSKRLESQRAKDESTTPLIKPMAKILAADPKMAKNAIPFALVEAGALKLLPGTPVRYQITATNARFKSSTLASKLSRLEQSWEFFVARIEYTLGGVLPPSHPVLHPSVKHFRLRTHVRKRKCS